MKNFDYEKVPSGFAHCFNRKCSRKKQCLRYMVAQSSTTQNQTITIVNPKCIPADVADCSFFKSNQQNLIAWGVSRLFDKLPYHEASTIRKKVISIFGRTSYYRIYRFERGIMPEEQRRIRNIFQSHGIETEPEFDKFTNEYNFR